MSATIVVPALNPGNQFIEFLNELKSAGFENVIVVNDGSDSSFDKIFKTAEKSLGYKVIKHSKNLGKGRAIKTALEECLLDTNLNQEVITCDADGQHSVKDILRIANQLQSNRSLGYANVILGSRNFKNAGIPWKSRLGNQTTSAVVALLFGKYLPDTQTGLRGFGIEHADFLTRVSGERFDYEMNVLLSLIRRGVKFDLISIETIYHDKDNSQSHFRPIADSLHIYFQILKFLFSSVASSVLDILLFTLFVTVTFNHLPDSQAILYSAVIARVCSSIFNFLTNRNLVFNDNGSFAKSIFKYYALVIVIGVASIFGSIFMNQILGGHNIFAKVLVDGALFVLSLVMQKRWVFASRLK